MRTRRTRRPLLAVIALATVMGASLATSAAAEELKLTLEKEVAVPTATATASATSTPTVEAPPRSLVPAYVMGGVGVVGLIAGGVLMGAGAAQRSDLAGKLPRDANGNLLCVRTAPDADPRCPSMRAQAGQADAFGNAGIVSLVAGGAVLAGAAAYFFWPAAKATPPNGAAHVVPTIGRDGAGLLWLGSF